MPKTKNVAPILASPSRRYYQWAAIAVLAKRHPNTWVLALTNVPAATVRAVKERRHPDLKNITGGALMAQARNVYRDDDGRQFGDLFVRFDPKEEA